MATTQYTIKRNGSKVDTRSSKASAVKYAEGLHAQDAGHVQVFTASGNEVFSVGSEVRKPQPGFRFPDYTRVDESPLKAEIEVPAGYHVAYRLPRDKAVICRSDTEPKGDLMVLIEGQKPKFARTTREASTLVYERRPVDKQPKQVQKVRASA